jgi:hypothetical protein
MLLPEELADALVEQRIAEMSDDEFAALVGRTRAPVATELKSAEGERR